MSDVRRSSDRARPPRRIDARGAGGRRQALRQNRHTRSTSVTTVAIDVREASGSRLVPSTWRRGAAFARLPCPRRESFSGAFSMNARHTMVMGIAALVVLGSVETAYAQAPRAYRIEDLGSLGGSYLIGLAINSHGDVAGYGDLPDGTYHAFRWTALGGLEDLGANGGWFAQAFDINDNGDVVGVYIDANNGEHGFIAPRGGVMQDLTTW